LLKGKPISQQIQYIANTDAHATNARTPATLGRVYGTSLGYINHLVYPFSVKTTA
jgi:hypothetical protein